MLRAIAVFLFLASTIPADDAGRALYATAAAGNLDRFEATLDRARTTADTMAVGAARNRLRHAVIVATDLDRVWRFDGIYWDEESLPDYYDRLANEYPSFEQFIAQYRVIDRAGRVLYPKQETRAFLLKQLRPANPKKRST